MNRQEFEDYCTKLLGTGIDRDLERNRISTKSTHSPTLTLFAFILHTFSTNDDYWDMDYGKNDLVFLLELHFKTEKDWADLEMDMNNWNYYQLERYAEGILYGEGLHESTGSRIGIFSSTPWFPIGLYYSIEGQSSLVRRLELLRTITRISKQNGFSFDIAQIMLDSTQIDPIAKILRKEKGIPEDLLLFVLDTINECYYPEIFTEEIFL